MIIKIFAKGTPENFQVQNLLYFSHNLKNQ